MVDAALADGIQIAPAHHRPPPKKSAPTAPAPRSSTGTPAVAAGGGGSGVSSASKPKQDKKLSMQELSAQYGFAAALFKSDKELEKLIQEAVKGQWSSAKFQAKFMATKWYRAHNAAARSWIELEARDPKTAQKQVDDQAALMRRQANQLGVSLSASRARKMARDGLMMGWNEQAFTNALVDEFEYRPGRTSGMTATLETFINSMAADYGVQVSNKKTGDWLAKTLRGDYTDDHLADMIRDMARSKYPGLSRYLDQGLSVADVAEPYLQSYANLLEVAPDTVTVFDPLVQRALQGTRQPQAKSTDPPEVQNLYDFERDLRKDSRWQYTQNAHRSTMDATMGILRDWGLVS